MSHAVRAAKASRHIPKHVERAVRARDGSRCRNCKVETEFLHYDHIIPYDLGGLTNAANVQLLCPTCNTSKGNRITCPKCGHWMAPDKANCSQCGARLTHTKHSETFAGRMDNLFQRVGKVVVLGGGTAVLLMVLIGGFYAYSRFRGSSSDSEQAASVSAIVNNVFNASPGNPLRSKLLCRPVPPTLALSAATR
jgi:hypothetical protein